jgi:hypothetical protein
MDAYEIMRYPVTVGRSVRHPESIAIRDIGYVMDCMQKGFYEGFNLQRAIQTLRGMADREAQKTAKLALPWFSGSLMRKKRSNLNVEKASFMIFDIDHVAKPEELKTLAMAKLPYIRFAFCSAVDGVKLVAQFRQPIIEEEKYRRIYTFIALQIEWVIKHICDTTSDWSRACFFSYDPNLITNINCTPLDPLVTYKQAISVMEIPFPRGNASHIVSPNQGKHGGLPLQDTPVGADPSACPPRICPPDDYAKAQAIIATMSTIPIVYRDWIKIGQALYAGFGEQGKALWDMFLNNPNYNDSQIMLDAHWRSFRNVRTISLASLFYVAEQYGVKYE